MSFKLRKLAINRNVIINMVIIKNMGRIMGKDKLQRNGVFNETGELCISTLCCPMMQPCLTSFVSLH